VIDKRGKIKNYVFVSKSERFGLTDVGILLTLAQKTVKLVH
jgi:hypothetical protein